MTFGESTGVRNGLKVHANAGLAKPLGSSRSVDPTRLFTTVSDRRVVLASRCFGCQVEPRIRRASD